MLVSTPALLSKKQNNIVELQKKGVPLLYHFVDSAMLKLEEVGETL